MANLQAFPLTNRRVQPGIASVDKVAIWLHSCLVGGWSVPLLFRRSINFFYCVPFKGFSLFQPVVPTLFTKIQPKTFGPLKLERISLLQLQIGYCLQGFKFSCSSSTGNPPPNIHLLVHLCILLFLAHQITEYRGTLPFSSIHSPVRRRRRWVVVGG